MKWYVIEEREDIDESTFYFCDSHKDAIKTEKDVLWMAEYEERKPKTKIVCNPIEFLEEWKKEFKSFTLGDIEISTKIKELKDAEGRG